MDLDCWVVGVGGDSSCVGLQAAGRRLAMQWTGKWRGMWWIKTAVGTVGLACHPCIFQLILFKNLLSFLCSFDESCWIKNSWWCWPVWVGGDCLVGGEYDAFGMLSPLCIF